MNAIFVTAQCRLSIKCNTRDTSEVEGKIEEISEEVKVKVEAEENEEENKIEEVEENVEVDLKEVAKDKKEIKRNSVRGERRQEKNNVFIIPAVDGDVTTSTFQDKHPSICVYDGHVNEKV